VTVHLDTLILRVNLILSVGFKTIWAVFRLSKRFRFWS